MSYKQGFIATIKCGKQVLQLMIKMRVFNKINDNFIVDSFKNVFQRRSSEVKTTVPYHLCTTVVQNTEQF